MDSSSQDPWAHFEMCKFGIIDFLSLQIIVQTTHMGTKYCR